MNGTVSGTVFVVLFRGVGGATQLPTASLRRVLSNAGFAGVSTYINSGNAVLSSKLGRRQTHLRIAEIVKTEFGFKKDIMLVERDEWLRIIRENPFPDAIDQPATLHLFVLADTPSSAAVDTLLMRAINGERVVIKNRILYLQVPGSFSASKLPPMIDHILGTVSTARNWRTVVALGKIAGEVG